VLDEPHLPGPADRLIASADRQLAQDAAEGADGVDRDEQASGDSTVESMSARHCSTSRSRTLSCGGTSGVAAARRAEGMAKPLGRRGGGAGGADVFSHAAPAARRGCRRSSGRSCGGASRNGRRRRSDPPCRRARSRAATAAGMPASSKCRQARTRTARREGRVVQGCGRAPRSRERAAHRRPPRARARGRKRVPHQQHRALACDRAGRWPITHLRRVPSAQ
jgi:hypothetical protein